MLKPDVLREVGRSKEGWLTHEGGVRESSPVCHTRKIFVLETESERSAILCYIVKRESDARICFYYFSDDNILLPFSCSINLKKKYKIIIIIYKNQNCSH